MKRAFDPPSNQPNSLISSVISFASPFLFVLVVVFGLALPSDANSQESKITPKSYGDWNVMCASEGNCIAFVRGPGVIVITGKNNKDNTMRVVFRVVKETGEGEPISLRFDNGTRAKLVTNSCNERHCQSAVALQAVPQIIAQFRKGAQGVAAYKAGERMVVAPFSLQGFTAAVNAMEQGG